MSVLLRAWGILIALTLLAMWAGSGQGLRLPLAVGSAIVLAASGLKAWMVLRYFLDLRRGSSGWQAGLSVYIGGLCLALYAVTVVGTGWR